MISKSIVKFEIYSVNVLCYSIYFHLWFKNSNLRILCANAIEIPSWNFFLEDWSFSHTNANPHICDFLMRFRFSHIKPVILYHFLIREFSMYYVISSHFSRLLSLLRFVFKHPLLLNFLSFLFQLIQLCNDVYFLGRIRIFIVESKMLSESVSFFKSSSKNW